MTWIAPAVARAEPSYVADERSALQDWLDYHRATLRLKCAGLTGEQLVIRPVPSSTLSLLGLVRHMTEVERGWFRWAFLGQHELPALYCDEQRDGDFKLTDPISAEADFRTYLAECAVADDAARGHSLDETFVHPPVGPRAGETMDLRWIYIHMIEEYARHNGHADLIRELIDGVTGD
jgi:hypothetical protein